MRGYVTTRDAAAILGLTTRYIRDEIRDGRLPAEVIPRGPRPGRRRGHAAYRIYPDDFSAYLARYWPRVRWQWPA